MAFRDIFKISRKTFFNPAGWFGYELFRSQTQLIVDVLRNLFAKPVPPTTIETFPEVMARLNLTEAEVDKGAKNYHRVALLFFTLSLFVLFYSFFLLFRYHSFLGWLLGLSVVGLFSAQAFKYDFWSLQMRRRQLGLSFADWKRSILGDKGHSV